MTDTIKTFKRKSGSMILLDDEIVTDKIQKPAKRWQNVYRIVNQCFINNLNKMVDPGQTVISDEKFPSKEIAEQKAWDVLEGNSKEFQACIEYLGAEPVP